MKYRIYFVTARGTYRNRIIRANDQAHAEKIAASHGYRSYARRLQSIYQEI